MIRTKLVQKGHHSIQIRYRYELRRPPAKSVRVFSLEAIMGAVILGIDFHECRDRKLDVIKVASEAYLETPDEYHFDKLVDCIKGSDQWTALRM